LKELDQKIIERRDNKERQGIDEGVVDREESKEVELSDDQIVGHVSNS